MTVLLRDALRHGDISRGDVIIYQWRKEEVVSDGLLARTHERVFFVAFMVETMREGTVSDKFGTFPQDHLAAIFKPAVGRERSILQWQHVQERMSTDTFDIMIHRLLDVYREGILFRDGQYFEVARTQSLTRFRMREASYDLVMLNEAKRDADEAALRANPAQELSRKLFGQEKRRG